MSLAPLLNSVLPREKGCHLAGEAAGSRKHTVEIRLKDGAMEDAQRPDRCPLQEEGPAEAGLIMVWSGAEMQAARLFEEPPRAKVLTASTLFRLSEAAQVFEDLPRATIFSVLRPDAGDIAPMLLSYTIEINYKQFTECIPGGAHGRHRGEECEAAPEDASTATDDLSGGKMHLRPSTSPPPHARDKRLLPCLSTGPSQAASPWMVVIAPPAAPSSRERHPHPTKFSLYLALSVMNTSFYSDMLKVTK